MTEEKVSANSVGTPAPKSGREFLANLRLWKFVVVLAVFLVIEFAGAAQSPHSSAATGTGLANVSMTTVAQTINPSASIDLAAQVTTGDGGATPTGTVVFFDESTNQNVATATLDANGAASKIVTGVLTIGGHNIAAKYAGDTQYAPVESLPVTIEVDKSSTSTTVTPATTSPSSGAPLSVTASITSTSLGATPPSGLVTFYLDGVSQGNKTVVEDAPSTATIKMTLPAAGSHNLQAYYSGDDNYDDSTSPDVIITIVSKGATVTTVTAAPPVLTSGSAETLTATIAPATKPNGASPNITGTVTFYDGANPLAGPIAINLAGGVFTAVLSNIKLSATASHSITAVYSGDSNWTVSTSAPLLLQAFLLPDTITLAADITTLAPGQAATLTATVTPASPPASNVEAHPTGNVIFYDGSTLLATVALAASKGDVATAVFTTGALPAGKNEITAKYVGDLYYKTATSTSITLEVEDFTIVADPANATGNLTIVQGSSGSATFDVGGLGGFNNQIQVVCAVPGGIYITCSPSPQLVSPPGKVVITVDTFTTGSVASASVSEPPPASWPRTISEAVLTFLGLGFLPFGGRARLLKNARATRLTIFALTLAAAGLASIGCGTSAKPAGGGTPLGVATLKITAAANVPNTVVSHSVFLSVNVIPQ